METRQLKNPFRYKHCITGIILASGYGRRAQCDKLLLPWQGKPLLFQVIKNTLLSSLQRVILVIQERHEEICKEYIANFSAKLQKKIKIVINYDSMEGMSASIRVGVNSLSQKSEGSLFLLADQPHFSPEQINSICQTFYTNKSFIIAPYYKEERKNPVLFPKKYNQQLLQLSQDFGARLLLEKHVNEVIKLHFDSPLIFEDIDTIENYNQMNSRNFSWDSFLANHQTVSLMGGGGKTSLLWNIAKKFQESNRDCILSTTTKMWNSAPDFVSITLSNFPHLGNYKHDTLPLFAKEISNENKLIGYDAELFDTQKWKDELSQSRTKNNDKHSALILEVDGSKNTNFKIHAENEPCIPKTTDLLIAVIGMDGIGKSIQSQVHRSELLPSHFQNAKFTINILLELLFMKRGYFHHLSPYNHILFLNHKESKTAYEHTRALAKKILMSPHTPMRFKGIVYGSNILNDYTFLQK